MEVYGARNAKTIKCYGKNFSCLHIDVSLRLVNPKLGRKSSLPHIRNG